MDFHTSRIFTLLNMILMTYLSFRSERAVYCFPGYAKFELTPENSFRQIGCRAEWNLNRVRF